MSRTFGELKTEIYTNCLGRSDAAGLVIAGNSINWALLEHFPKVGLRPFLAQSSVVTVVDQEYVAMPSGFDGVKSARLVNPSKYSNGTVAVTNGATTVEGTSVSWIVAAIRAGDFIKFGTALLDGTGTPDTWYEIASITDLDTLEITAGVSEAVVAGASYCIRRVESEVHGYTTLVDMVWEDFEQSQNDTGEPKYKIVIPSSTGWRMYLRPVPNQVYTIKLWYIAKETELTADGTTPQLSTIYGDAPIISAAAWRTALTLGLDQEANRWGSIFNKVDLPELLSWQGRVDGLSPSGRSHNPYK